MQTKRHSGAGALLVRAPNLIREDYLQWAGFTPESLLTLASYLSARDLRCKILDLYRRVPNAPARSPAERNVRLELLYHALSGSIETECPALIGFSCLSNGDTWTSVSLAAKVKERYPELPVILGGYFPTCNSEPIISACPAVDAVVVGEGETTLAELLTRLTDGRPAFDESVPSLCFRSGHSVITTRRAERLDLRLAPPMDFSLLDGLREYDTLVYHTSRGCPWRCSYCTEATVKPGYGAKSPELVRRDLTAFMNVNPRAAVYFSDPVFSVSERRTEDLIAALSRTGVSYYFSTRVDLLPARHVPALKQSGCFQIYFGIESGSFETLLRMNKLRPATYRQYQNYLQGGITLAKACGENAIHYIGGVMIGYPGDGLEDLNLTMKVFQDYRAMYLAGRSRAGGAARFIVLPFRVDLPTGSEAWDARGYYRLKGLELADEGLFGSHTVTRCSRALGNAEMAAFSKAFEALSTEPNEESRRESVHTRTNSSEPGVEAAHTSAMQSERRSGEFGRRDCVLGSGTQYPRAGQC